VFLVGVRVDGPHPHRGRWNLGPGQERDHRELDPVRDPPPILTLVLDSQVERGLVEKKLTMGHMNVECHRTVQGRLNPG